MSTAVATAWPIPLTTSTVVAIDHVPDGTRLRLEGGVVFYLDYATTVTTVGQGEVCAINPGRRIDYYLYPLDYRSISGVQVGVVVEVG